MLHGCASLWPTTTACSSPRCSAVVEHERPRRRRRWRATPAGWLGSDGRQRRDDDEQQRNDQPFHRRNSGMEEPRDCVRRLVQENGERMAYPRQTRRTIPLSCHADRRETRR